MGGMDMAMEGGFRSPVFDAQAIFRAVMRALAEPGTVQDCAPLAVPPPPLNGMAGAIAQTLCDHDTPIWLDPALARSDEVAAWLSFHCGAPITDVAAEAHFAFAGEPSALIGIENFAQGSQEYPNRSATLVLQVETLTEGSPLILSGPGIRDTAELAPAPLPQRFRAQWKQNNARFPRGVDILFAAPQGIAALPRTTRIEPTEDGACM